MAYDQHHRGREHSEDAERSGRMVLGQSSIEVSGEVLACASPKRQPRGRLPRTERRRANVVLEYVRSISFHSEMSQVPTVGMGDAHVNGEKRQGNGVFE